MSIANFHIYLYKIIHKEINEAFPMPDCPQKKQKVIWQREEVLTLLAEKIKPTSNGLNLTIELNTSESE